MTGRGRPPAERVRARLRTTAGADVARRLPHGYQRLGRVLVLRLPESLRPYFARIGEAWRAELGVDAVIRHAGRTEGEWRRPLAERIAGESTTTEVRENGLRYRLDPMEVMFAAGNRTERRRIGTIVRPGETVVDLFAGIGYFALPAAVLGRAHRVHAIESNPTSFRFLLENIQLNGVSGCVVPTLGDNRAVDLPPGGADRAILGYLPSSLDWVGRGSELLRPAGGTLHVHLVANSRLAVREAEEEVALALDRTGRSVRRIRAREVKPYGPGRTHVVVDAELGSVS